MEDVLGSDTSSQQQQAATEHPFRAIVDIKPSSEQETIESLLRQRSEIDTQMSQLSARQSQIVTIGILAVFSLLVIEVMFFAHRYYILEKGVVLGNFFGNIVKVRDSLVTPLAFLTNVVLVGLSIVLMAVVIYQVGYRRHFKSLARARARVEEDLHGLQVRTPEGWRTYLQEELRRLSYVSSNLFIRHQPRGAQVKRLAKDAEQNLKEDAPGALIDAEFQINAIKKLVLGEEQEQADQAAWRKLATAIMVVYIALVLLSLVFPSTHVPVSDLGKGKVYVFGIPPLIVVWAAIGSLAAILYRFYTLDAPMRYDIEVRWLIARPIVGIIMGLLAYLALEAGLVLLTGPSVSPIGMRPEIALVVAFLGGFSDKFYTKIIDLLLYRTTGQDSSDRQDAGGNP